MTFTPTKAPSANRTGSRLFLVSDDIAYIFVREISYIYKLIVSGCISAVSEIYELGKPRQPSPGLCCWHHKLASPKYMGHFRLHKETHMLPNLVL